MLKQIMSLILLSVLLLMLISLWGFYVAIRPFKIVSDNTPQQYGIPFEKIELRTQDKVLLRGWYIPSQKRNAKTVILLHGYPADKGDILPSRIFLHKDFNLLFLDFRYLGESEGWYSTAGKNEVLDLRAAIAFLEQRGIKEVGVWGFSLGGAVALMAAPNTPQIKAIVVESSYANLQWMVYDYYPIPLLRYPLGALTQLWARIFLGYDASEISPEQAAKQLTIPVLLLSSRHDEVITFKHAQRLEAALANNKRAKIIFVDTGRHGEPMENYQLMVKKFFDENL